MKLSNKGFNPLLLRDVIRFSNEKYLIYLKPQAATKNHLQFTFPADCPGYLSLPKETVKK